MKRLNDYGFTNVEPEYIADEAPKNQVIDQSVSDGMELDVNTRIVLTVSTGPAETEPEETEPKTVTRQVDIPLPEMEESYILGLFLNGKPVRESLTIQPGTKTLTVELTGAGVQIYALYMNGEPMDEPYGTYEVDFGTNE